jgi:L-aspartate oxidase
MAANGAAAGAAVEAADDASASGRAGHGAPGRAPVPVVPEAAEFQPLPAPEDRTAVQRIMTEGAGVLRSADSLRRAAEELAELHTAAAEGRGKKPVPGTETWETANLLLVARVLVEAARRREETRGCHWREDRPDRDDEQWRRHIVVRLGEGRTLAVHTTDGPGFAPVTTPTGAVKK